MSIIVGCRSGKRFAAQPHLAGKRVNCPECGSPIAILGYESTLPKRSASLHALTRISWVDPVRIDVDESAGTLTVGVRGGSVSTAAAKSALEQAGFKIGSTTYKGAVSPRKEMNK